jgi:hypothetical protein
MGVNPCGMEVNPADGSYIPEGQGLRRLRLVDDNFVIALIEK